MFRIVDRDRSGTLDYDEFVAGIKHSGLVLSRTQTKALFVLFADRGCDKGGGGGFGVFVCGRACVHVCVCVCVGVSASKRICGLNRYTSFWRRAWIGVVKFRHLRKPPPFKPD